jgi:hypothetical protein
LIAAGLADFSLIAFHFQKTATVPQGSFLKSEAWEAFART